MPTILDVELFLQLVGRENPNPGAPPTKYTRHFFAPRDS